jgi:hypothetical protein
MQRGMTESYLNKYDWHCDGDRTPWLPGPDAGGDSIYDGKITTQADAADYAVGERDDAAVEALAAAKKIIIKLPPGIVSLELRARSDGSENDANVLQVFCAAGIDHYLWHDQLTFTQGTQLYSGSIYFADTLTSSGEQWLTDTRQISPTSDHVARNVMNVHGYDRIWIVASTLATTTCYVDWKQL